MSQFTIYRALRDGGLSEAGAYGVMGNIGAESAFKSNNVEDRSSLSDFDYTHNVDVGIISKERFSRDSYGYGLAQWTYFTRKAALYDFAKWEKGTSISDEQMQVEFLLKELKTEYSGLYNFLCQTNDIYEATSKVCWDYENPAIKNVDARYEIALDCKSRNYEVLPIDPDGPKPEKPVIPVSCKIEVRVLKTGDKGRDVGMAQWAIRDLGLDIGKTGPKKDGVDGDFGGKTEAAVNQLREQHGMETSGLIDQDIWQILFQ